MPTPTLSATNRFFLPETTKVLLLDTVASMAIGPTRTELTAGLEVADEIAAITGFTVQAAMLQAADLGKRFSPQVGGRVTAAESRLTFWADKAGDDIRQEVAEGDQKFIVFLDGGDVPGSPMGVFQCTCTMVGRMRDIEALGRLDTGWAIRAYEEDLVVPAAA